MTAIDKMVTLSIIKSVISRVIWTAEDSTPPLLPIRDSDDRLKEIPNLAKNLFTALKTVFKYSGSFSNNRERLLEREFAIGTVKSAIIPASTNINKIVQKTLEKDFFLNLKILCSHVTGLSMRNAKPSPRIKGRSMERSILKNFVMCSGKKSSADSASSAEINIKIFMEVLLNNFISFSPLLINLLLAFQKKNLFIFEVKFFSSQKRHYFRCF